MVARLHIPWMPVFNKNQFSLPQHLQKPKICQSMGQWIDTAYKWVKNWGSWLYKGIEFHSLIVEGKRTLLTNPLECHAHSGSSISFTPDATCLLQQICYWTIHKMCVYANNKYVEGCWCLQDLWCMLKWILCTTPACFSTVVDLCTRFNSLHSSCKFLMDALISRCGPTSSANVLLSGNYNCNHSLFPFL